MQDLTQSLYNADLGHLRIIAELWGLELNAPDARSGLQQLAPALLDEDQIQGMLTSLPEEAHAALDDLLRNQGKMPWALFTRRYGSLREMGPGRRDRERPHLKPTSPAEALWYRALIARAFIDAPSGPQEFAYIPTDLLAKLPSPHGKAGAQLGRPASSAERAHPLPASDRILDQACTLLAALRLEFEVDRLEKLAESWGGEPDSGELSSSSGAYALTSLALQALLSAAGLLDASGMPNPEATRLTLEAPRGEALAQLARAWLHSPVINELRMLPGLVCEGEWQNDSLQARHTVLDFLSTVPGDGWWSLSAFVAAIREAHPDFQRPAGDYDSWYIRELNSGEFLRGFENWERVDGALLRYLICGPLHWLGILDLAAPGAQAAPTAFRRSRWAEALLLGQAPEGLAVEEEVFLVQSNARIRVPLRTSRAARYQLARFSTWQGESEDAYRYRLTPASLERARHQGLKVSHLLSLLSRHASAVPPSLVKALERWERQGREARLERVTVLRLRSPQMLQALRASRAARFLGDLVGPTTVIVRSGAEEKVLEVLAEMGYLGEADFE